MKYLDPHSVEIARTIAGVLPKTTDQRDDVAALTALTVLMFAVADKINIPPSMVAGTAIPHLAQNADAAIAELTNEGVNI